MSNIIRVKKEKNYVVMDKTALRDDNLSWRAKGIIAYMLSLPDDWTFHMNELARHSNDGKTSFRNGFNELKKHGYVKRIKTRRDDGTFQWETLVYERPHTDLPQVDNPHVEKPQVEKPHVVNRTLLSNKELSIEELNNKELNNDKHSIPYVEIVDYLNRAANKNFRSSTGKTKTLIKARYKEGFSLEDFKKVIDTKVREWKNDKNMNKFLRPETLFGTKFESYLNQDVKEDNCDSQYDNLF